MSKRKELFEKWFQYNHDANLKFIECFESQENPIKEAQRLQSHIFNSHLVWLNRMKPLKEIRVPEIWENHATSSFRKLNDECLKWTQWFLMATDFGTPLGKRVQYQNSKGIGFESEVQEIYTHILMHSMYHRGQVAKQLKMADVQPPSTDYIMQTRSKVELQSQE